MVWQLWSNYTKIATNDDRMDSLICVMNCSSNYNYYHGFVLMTQVPVVRGADEERSPIQDRGVPKGVQFFLNVHNVEPGLHGFHVHRSGDLSRGCESLCSHYNPEGYNHGTLNQINAHKGDLGNVIADNKGDIVGTLISNRLTLDELRGRSLILHQNEDDLGLGPFPDSKTTGHSGKRILCGVIGYKEV